MPGRSPAAPASARRRTASRAGAHRRGNSAAGGIAAVDVYAAATRARKETEMELAASITVNTSAAEVYRFWQQLENLPSFMAHVDGVRTDGRGGSHWTVSAPFGRSIEWDAVTTENIEGRRIAWRSTDDADIANEGAVDFAPAPGGRGTEVHVRISYSVPGGKLGEAVARYFGEDPHQQLDDDLRRLKQVLETGEVIRSEGAPGGKRARKEFPQHAAQPLTDAEFAEVMTA
jgi:uncharacterized membrane protein